MSRGKIMVGQIVNYGLQERRNGRLEDKKIEQLDREVSQQPGTSVSGSSTSPLLEQGNSRSEVWSDRVDCENKDRVKKRNKLMYGIA